MKVGLFNLEPQINNTAMMQVSQFHKQLGDKVEVYSPLYHQEYDKIYAFSIFDFTPKDRITKAMFCGGTGFDLFKKLTPEMESCDYDYSIFPNCKTSYIWFSRGCIRDCPFCVVRKKEGFIHPVIPKCLNPKGEYISIMDNNFFANPKWREAIEQIKIWNQPITFQSGLDARIFNEEQGEALRKLNIYKRIYFAWDNTKDDLRPKFQEILQYIKAYKIMVYVLIGFNSTPEEDLYRVEELRKLKIDPFVMPFNKKDRYQRDFARWVNFKAIFKSVKWEDYKKSKKL
jgi:hypothetical protein